MANPKRIVKPMKVAKPTKPAMKTFMKKSMKAMKPMKLVMKTIMKRAMKAMKVSSVARGSRMRASVLAGKKEKTYTGLKASDLIKNKRGKIVSKTSSAGARQRYEGSKLQKWVQAVKVARKQLALTGFVAVNSSTPEGQAVYAKAKAIYTSEA
eukprot:TRINITY_DN2990_c0_g1_i12.p1 TRINITY_DN2990_c0_g1~~TRINITY_DN2990_c0_g1_i12.p1  ORF type:complete len:153 (-),score=27.50 TRINITY_DN2990_c0_g1_i12:241-699(-)